MMKYGEQSIKNALINHKNDVNIYFIQIKCKIIKKSIDNNWNK